MIDDKPTVRLSIFPNHTDQTGETLTLRGTFRIYDEIIRVDEVVHNHIPIDAARRRVMNHLAKAVGHQLVHDIWEAS